MPFSFFVFSRRKDATRKEEKTKKRHAKKNEKTKKRHAKKTKNNAMRKDETRHAKNEILARKKLFAWHYLWKRIGTPLMLSYSTLKDGVNTTTQLNISPYCFIFIASSLVIFL